MSGACCASLAVSIPNGDKHDFKLHGRLFIVHWPVSIPNGDKHDFKRLLEQRRSSGIEVSIPNGDKHDFKPRFLILADHDEAQFQSPMGISMISNVSWNRDDHQESKFQSPMGISMISN